MNPPAAFAVTFLNEFAVTFLNEFAVTFLNEVPAKGVSAAWPPAGMPTARDRSSGGPAVSFRGNGRERTG